MMPHRLWPLLLTLWLLSPGRAQVNQSVAVIQIVDEQSGRGVPLVELETIAHQRFVTDSHGRVAISTPDLLGRNIFFTLSSHGYEFPQDGFGFSGTAVELRPGSQTQLKVRRLNIAERLYRVTGSGIYVDSVIAGLHPAENRQLLPGDVVGCDSVMTAMLGDQIYWFWGDTSRPHHPLGGNFHMTAATTPVLSTDAQGQPTADHPPRFNYITGPEAAIRSVAQLAGEGPTWLSAITVLPDSTARQAKPTMVAGFIKVRHQLEAYRWGYATWNPITQTFQESRSFDVKPRMFCQPQTHTFLHRDGQVEHVYFANPLPLTRVKASLTAFIDPDQYEGYSCLKPGTDIEQAQLDRDAKGQLIYAWKTNTPSLDPQTELKFVRQGLIQPHEAITNLRDIETGKPLVAHSGSVHWNKLRQRWIMITVEIGGQSSHLGEVWFAEADQPTGPWRYARKIVTHKQYSFYNPKHHPFLDSPEGNLVHFEGTYTTTFSGNPYPTERYDYNQLMYRLDLKDSRLALPVAMYPGPVQPGSQNTGSLDAGPHVPTSWHNLPEKHRATLPKPLFFALDRPIKTCAAFVYHDGQLKASTASTPSEPVAFYAYTQKPTDQAAQALTPLYQYTHNITSARLYSTQAEAPEPNMERAPQPIAWVWKAD